PFFSAKCARCGRCVAACPSKILTLDADAAPKINFDAGFCEKECVACGNACPTGALVNLTPTIKPAAKKVAVKFNIENCLIYYQTECQICRRECPFEAIEFIWSDEEYASYPVIDLDKCAGCGRCAHFCPGLDDVKALIMVPLEDVKTEKA
ncbi:MAG: 4Fe-4S dicluster domain-containing protein, partial [Thermoguttaceae bacterium]|nr:4Fe-4S dicluster domain-containing protein [Thermoguttaceae bacterium]